MADGERFYFFVNLTLRKTEKLSWICKEILPGQGECKIIFTSV